MESIKNVANYAKDYKYIVARRENNNLWFWGAWNDRDKANKVADEINGIVIENF